MSSFDEVKNYYVFKYVVDSVSGEPTEYEGEIQAFVKATDPWEAVENAGFDDANAYGANLMDNENLGTFTDAIAKERKHLSKISKELKGMSDELESERAKYFEERPCPNGCGKLDEKFSCPNCGYGHEADDLIKDIEKTIEEEKKKGNDVLELEGIRDAIKASA